MSTLQDKIKIKLENHPKFRERRFRAPYLMILALRETGLEAKYEWGHKFTLDELVSIAKTYDSFRHEYDAVLKANPQLQGSDYGDGKRLAQEKQIEFGYEGGYRENIKTLQLIK